MEFRRTFLKVLILASCLVMTMELGVANAIGPPDEEMMYCNMCAKGTNTICRADGEIGDKITCC